MTFCCTALREMHQPGLTQIDLKLCIQHLSWGKSCSFPESKLASQIVLVCQLINPKPSQDTEKCELYTI